MIDISDPTDPRIVGKLDRPDNVFGVTVSGGYAYVAGKEVSGFSGLQVIDVGAFDEGR